MRAIKIISWINQTHQLKTLLAVKEQPGFKERNQDIKERKVTIRWQRREGFLSWINLIKHSGFSEYFIGFHNNVYRFIQSREC